MHGSRKWSNVPGVFSIEVQSIRSVISEYEGEEIPPLYGIVVPGVDELVIEFTSSGYYQPMSMYGGWYRLGWPEDGDDERLLSRAYLLAEKCEVELPPDVQAKLFDLYEDRIYEVELTWEDE